MSFPVPLGIILLVQECAYDLNLLGPADAGMKKKKEVREDIFRELIQASIMLLQKLDFVALRSTQVS